MPASGGNQQITRNDTAILSIGLFKLVKGLLLVLVGVGAHALLHRDIGDTILKLVDALRVDPDNRYVHAALERVLNVTPNQLKEISAGTFIYAGAADRGHWSFDEETLGRVVYCHINRWFDSSRGVGAREKSDNDSDRCAGG